MKQEESNMEYKIYVTTYARRMINNHLKFLSNISYEATKKLEEEFEHYIDILIYFPRVGAIIENKEKSSSENRRMIINKRYILIYSIIENDISIVYMLDCRQNNEKYLY